LQQAKELSLSLLGAWKDQLVTLQDEIDRALGVVLEGLKGLGGIGLFQKPKCVGRHKGRLRWAPKRRPKVSAYVSVLQDRGHGSSLFFVGGEEVRVPASRLKRSS
jgi:hypothetical protein